MKLCDFIFISSTKMFIFVNLLTGIHETPKKNTLKCFSISSVYVYDFQRKNKAISQLVTPMHART